MFPFTPTKAVTLLVLAMSYVIEGHAQSHALTPLTLAQLVEFCAPEMKASDEYLLQWLDKSAQKQRERGQPKIAQGEEARAADLRARGYESVESINGPSTLEWVNRIKTRKEVRAMIVRWQEDWANAGGTTRASAPARLCTLALREAQIEGRSMAGAVAALSFRQPGADDPMSRGGSAKVRNR